MTKRKAERNLRILAEKREGASFSALARKYGLTVEGIRQVVVKEERRERRGPLVDILSPHGIRGLERFCEKKGIPIPQDIDGLREALTGDWKAEIFFVRQVGPKTIAELEALIRSEGPDPAAGSHKA